MTGLEHFQRLKSGVLSEYRKHFPYFNGNWKTFGAQDIQNLIGLIEENLKETVSEKWIYTHLKPEYNDKLPRKDMLDIFCRFCGYSGWDEFVFEDAQQEIPVRKDQRKYYFLSIVFLITIGIVAFFIPKNAVKSVQTIKVTDEFTKQPLQKEEVKVYQIEENKAPIEVENNRVAVAGDKKTKLVVKSPFYKLKIVELKHPVTDTTEIRVIPDDHAMMLKAFMKSDIKDWQTRKIQLNQILSDNLEVIVMLKDNLGAEYFNKKEFSEKLVIPTPSVRKMKIIEIKNGADSKIQFIRIAQE
jgi:hypothetical protein